MLLGVDVREEHAHFLVLQPAAVLPVHPRTPSGKGLLLGALMQVQSHRGEAAQFQSNAHDL